MKKLLTLGLFALMVFSIYLESVSAYAYGGCVGCDGSYGYAPADYDAVSYHRVSSNGGNIRYTDFDRATTESWVGGAHVRSTTYTRTTSEVPRYNYGYAPVNYGSYNAPRYGNDPFWYRRYWDNQPTYYRQNPYSRGYSYGYW